MTRNPSESTCPTCGHSREVFQGKEGSAGFVVEKKGKRCRWKFDGSGAWETSCDNAFYLDAETPSENRMKFCCFCGLLLEEIE